MTASSNGLGEHLQRALQDEEARDKITITLNVGGGAPSERYELSLTVSGSGRVQYEYLDELRNQPRRSGTGEIGDDRVRALLATILESGLLGEASSAGQFPPGTTVGTLEIVAAGEQFRTRFAADPGQTGTEEAAMTPEVEQVVEELYRLGAEVIGVERVRP